MNASQPRSNSGRFHLDEELIRVELPVEKVGNSLLLKVFIFLAVLELCILSLPDIWAAPNEAYIIAT